MTTWSKDATVILIAEAYAGAKRNHRAVQSQESTDLGVVGQGGCRDLCSACKSRGPLALLLIDRRSNRSLWCFDWLGSDLKIVNIWTLIRRREISRFEDAGSCWSVLDGRNRLDAQGPKRRRESREQAGRDGL